MNFSIFARLFFKNMPLVYTIELKVDPLVAGWMERSFKKKRGVFRIGDSCWYGLVSSMLCQSHVKTPSVMPEKYASFVPVKVAVSEYDFYHYGWEVSPLQEVRFSRLVRNFIIDECLRNVAILRARYDMPISQAITYYSIFFGMEEEQVKFETLRKIYRRKYQNVEEEYRKLDAAAISDFGTIDRKPARKELRIRHLGKNDPNQILLF